MGPIFEHNNKCQKAKVVGNYLLPRLTAMKNVHQYSIEILYRNLGKWQNMAQIDKKNPTNSGIMQSQRKTGGRPAARLPTTTTAKIISLR